MSFLKSSFIIMRCDLNQSLAFPVCGSDQGLLRWENWVLMMPNSPLFLFLMFSLLLLTIWLSVELVGLAVSAYGLSLLKACVSVLLGDQLSLGGILVWRAVAQGQLMEFTA